MLCPLGVAEEAVWIDVIEGAGFGELGHLVSRQLRDRSSTAGRALGETFTSDGLGVRRAAFAEAVLETGRTT